MATIVSFHAHPDDEAIACGGTLVKAARAGHRVVLVFGTKGEHGEVDEGVLRDGESLWERRVAETERAAELLGAARVEFLGYVDSGMMGTPENDAPNSFWRADLDEAARRLADILRDESADIATIYDHQGNYGHPDHIKVHQVGVRAAEFANTPRVYEATINRDHMIRVTSRAKELGMSMDDAPDFENPDLVFGMPEAVITTVVDVRDVTDVKRAAMAAHASQIAETSLFLQMPEEVFREVFGFEWYIRHGVPSDHREHDLFDGL